MNTTVLAFDFGASSGRAISACFDGETICCREVHRFENKPIQQNGLLRWNFAELMQNVYQGIEKAGPFDSIGFDAWGIDFGLLDKEGKLLANPVHYRDKRTTGMAARACKRISAFQLYEETGNQIMDMNTLFQLLATDLSEADKMLFMPDLFLYQLCGTLQCEYTVASTSQMLNPVSGKWSEYVLRLFGISENLFAPLIKSGTIVGEYQGAKVIAVAGHDTQCAVAAMPTQREDVAFLSCGTWSLLGTELAQPVLTVRSKRTALSNEIGANGAINYLKNIAGLWLLQECRRAWGRNGTHYTYAEMERMAAEQVPFQFVINPDAEMLSLPGDLPTRICALCHATGQSTPQTPAQIMRCIYDSLAIKYSIVLQQLSQLTGKKFSALHLLGGGAKDALLCQLTANCCGLAVVAGPVEATALGNSMIQLMALGKIESIAHGRSILERQEKLNSYRPQSLVQWTEQQERLIQLCLQTS